jgi:hypothetical protein
MKISKRNFSMEMATAKRLDPENFPNLILGNAWVSTRNPDTVSERQEAEAPNRRQVTL